MGIIQLSLKSRELGREGEDRGEREGRRGRKGREEGFETFVSTCVETLNVQTSLL